jgi:hypothetical protein
MERAEVLLEKLRNQLREKAGREQLQLTLRMLYEAVMQTAVPGTQGSSGRVSVVFPATTALPFTSDTSSMPQDKIIETLHVDEAEIEAELKALKESADLKNELSVKARVMPVIPDEPAEEIPTLASHLPYLPANNTHTASPANPPESLAAAVSGTTADTSQQVERSLNDRLRAAQKELSEQLQEAPIRDLRKAIGINDRYVFINELFGGNEAMYERSLKTLNTFSILPEAEFWMQRELQVKMGWKDDDPLVLQFIQLVRRRFS